MFTSVLKLSANAVQHYSIVPSGTTFCLGDRYLHVEQRVAKHIIIIAEQLLRGASNMARYKKCSFLE